MRIEKNRDQRSKACREKSAESYSGAYPFILSPISVSFVLVNFKETAQ